MRKSTTAGAVVLSDDQGVWSVIEASARLHPERIVLVRTDGPDGAHLSITGRELAEHARIVGAELLALGVAHGDRIAIMGRTSYSWALLSYAAQAIGAVIVPVYPTASETQVRHTVTDSGVAWAFAESAEQVRLATDAGAATLRRPAWALTQVDDWVAVAVAGGGRDAAELARLADEFAQRAAKVRADDVAMIIYTSGTTGPAKGAVLTHRNMFASSANTVEHTGEMFRTAPDGTQAATAIALPLAHVFGQTILLACLYAGSRTVLLPGVPELVSAMVTIRPSFLALVPYALEKIRKRVRDLPHDEVAAVCGGRLTQVISGGASLDETTAAFFASAGVNVLNCYGLTEAATAVTVNQPSTNRRATVGRPIPGTTVAIADDGEVLVQGANVSPGYWSRATGAVGRDATGPAEETWLRTGDVGHLDDDGYLVITGRRKEILVTATGKNVAPTPLEDRIRLHPLVSNCMVVGEGRSFVSALLTLDQGPLAAWAAANGVTIAGPDGTAAAGDEGDADDADDVDGLWWQQPRLLAELQLAVDDANSLVSRAESIRKFCVLDTELTIDGGHLTPSMKLRRAAIERDFTKAISFIYQ